MPTLKQEHLSIPLEDDDDINNFTIGDTVEISVVGEIDRLEAEREYDYGPDDKDKYPPELGVKIKSVKVKAKTKIERMVDAEEDED